MINSNNRFTDTSTLPNDELDDLLKRWHDANAETAKANRNELLKRLTEQHATPLKTENAAPENIDIETTINQPARYRILPSMRLVASIALVAFIGLLLVPNAQNTAFADLVYLPDGGQLEARDEDGNLLGPCPLKHTDVDVEISGFFSRVTVTQHFKNTYNCKIEAVYTFPLSHNAAVDHMRMTIDEERIIDGEVKERQQARQIYESARQAGNVTALLEQERPNIFTQSVANIEPNVTIDVEISYVETILPVDGVYSFVFPMTVAPRYIPGYAPPARGLIPAELRHRQGIILHAPATINQVAIVDDRPPDQQNEPMIGMMTTIPVGRSVHLENLLKNAIPIQTPGPIWWGEDQTKMPKVAAAFDAVYPDGTTEFGVLLDDGTGNIAQRWFYVDKKAIGREGDGFEANTNQVPDASRITPMPVHPLKRAGHDISVRVSIDTGGPDIKSIESELHEISAEKNAEELSHSKITLANQSEIPNRDFVLKWQVEEDSIEEATFIHADAQRFPDKPGFFTLILNPPARVEDADVRPRELIFVLDTSGSMKGEPIEKAKAVMTRAIDSMRDNDTFNIITFAGDTNILWDESRPNTNDNRSKALAWVNSRKGSGGTEMMTAIEAALNPNYKRTADRTLKLKELADLPADGREVSISIGVDQIEKPPDFAAEEKNSYSLRVSDDLQVLAQGVEPLPLSRVSSEGGLIRATGLWVTVEGRRVFVYAETTVTQTPNNRMRICMFFTDGEVGNDMGIVAAVKKYAKTTRVFAFGIGNSINRYLLANMAHAGRGEVEFVTQNSDRGDAIERFARRVDSPVLTDIELEFSEGMEITDVLPLSPVGLIPDLYDEKPLIIHGRYAKAGEGTLTIKGQTGQGEYKRTINLSFPKQAADHNTIATIWARAKIDELMNEDLNGIQLQNPMPELKNEIVKLGEQFQIMSQFTSFVAVEKSRVTVKGQPILVTVPIELPNDADWSGFFCSDGTVNLQVLSSAVNEFRFDADSLRQPVLYAANNKARGMNAIAAGVTALKEGRWEDAANAFTTTLKYLPNNTEAIFGLRSAQEQLGQVGTLQGEAQMRILRAKAAKEEFDAAMVTAEELLIQEQFRQAQQTVIAAQVQLNDTRSYLNKNEIDERNSKARTLVAQLDQAEEMAQATPLQREQAEITTRRQEAPAAEQRIRQTRIDQNLRRVRELQMQQQYSEALQVTDQILLLDENNAAALALRDIIQTAELWQSFILNERTREFGYSNQFQENRLATDAPGPNILGPGPKSTTGIMAYPEDWPNLSIRKTTGEEGIKVHGNEFSKEKVIRRGLSFRPGNKMYKVSTPEAEKNLSRLRLWSDVEVEVSPTTVPQLRPITDSGGSQVVVPFATNLAVDFSVNDKQVAESGKQPLLGDIPILGAVFKKKPTDDNSQMFDNAPAMDLDSALRSPDEEQFFSFSVEVPFDNGTNKKSLTNNNYPDDWPNLSIRRTSDSGFGDISGALDHKVMADFENERLEKTLYWVCSMANINLIVDWKSLSTIGVSPDDMVSFRWATVVPLRVILKKIFNQVGDEVFAPSYAVVNDQLIVAAGESLADTIITLVYDVQDIMTPMPYFEGAPGTRLDAALRSDNGEQTQRTNTQSDLAVAIKSNIDRKSWNEFGGKKGNLQELGGNLIITQTLANHRTIQNLLNQLREIREVPTDVMPRFQTVEILALRINQIATTQETVESTYLGVDANLDQSESESVKETVATNEPPALFYLFDLNDPSVSQFFFERAVMLVNDIADADYFDEAATLAKWIIEIKPTLKPALEMHAVLIDEALPVDEKKSKVAKLSLVTENAIAQTILNAALEVELERRVESALLARVIREAMQEPDTTDSDSNAAKDVIVCILLMETDNQTITGLRDAGLKVAEIVESTRLAVGTARLDQIPSIALTPGVRRVEEVATQY